MCFGVSGRCVSINLFLLFNFGSFELAEHVALNSVTQQSQNVLGTAVWASPSSLVFIFSPSRYIKLIMVSAASLVLTQWIVISSGCPLVPLYLVIWGGDLWSLELYFGSSFRPERVFCASARCLETMTQAHFKPPSLLGA